MEGFDMTNPSSNPTNNQSAPTDDATKFAKLRKEFNTVRPYDDKQKAVEENKKASGLNLWDISDSQGQVDAGEVDASHNEFLKGTEMVE